MPPQKKDPAVVKKWAFVDSRLVVKEARKRGTIKKKLIELSGRKKYFSSFESAEKYRKQNKVKGVKSIPVNVKSLYLEQKEREKKDKDLLAKSKAREARVSKMLGFSRQEARMLEKQRERLIKPKLTPVFLGGKHYKKKSEAQNK